MSSHTVGTRDEWLAARLELLEAEKELTRRSDELARRRRDLPWVPVEKDYRFETEDGEASLRDLFGGRSQLLVYHFMFEPDWDDGCPSCSAVTDGFAGSIPHFEHHDVAFVVVSRAPLDKLVAYKRRMGWDLRWVSSFGSSFNYDFHVTIDPDGGAGRVQLPGPGAARGGERRLARLVGRATRHERVRPRRRRRVPHVLRVRPRLRRAVADVAVAGPCAAGPQRRRPVMVPPARRVPRDRGRTVLILTIKETANEHTPDRVAAGVGGRAPATAREGEGVDPRP